MFATWQNVSPFREFSRSSKLFLAIQTTYRAGLRAEDSGEEPARIMHSVKGSDAKASQSTENRTPWSSFPSLATKGGNLRSICVLCESSRGTVRNAVVAQLQGAAGRQPLNAVR